MSDKPLCTGNDINPFRSRRKFLSQFGQGLGSIALGSLLNPSNASAAKPSDGVMEKLDFAPKAKRVIYLFQSGGPSQMDLYDHKPLLNKLHGQELPKEVRGKQRLTNMSGFQSSLPLVGSPFKFEQHGDSGAWMSELLPKTAKIADELCIIKTAHTEAINHGPGVTMMQTGSQFPGRPSMGSWLHYGLGSENEDLPAFVVMVSNERGGQPLTSALWGSGFLPGKYDGVELRAAKDAVLYLNSPKGVDRSSRRKALDHLQKLHHLELEATSDPPSRPTNCMEKTRENRVPMRRIACVLVGWRRRVCVSFSFINPAGTTTPGSSVQSETPRRKRTKRRRLWLRI